MKKIFKVILSLVMVLVLNTLCFAAATKTVNVTATVPNMTGVLNVTVSQIDAITNVWLQSGANLPIAFTTLDWDSTSNIFRAKYYYAVDIGVLDNTGTEWLLTHTRSSIQKDAINNLDNNVNVSFVKQLTSNTDSQLQKVSYANSNNIGYGKTALSGGWLRIYYGIAAGSNDAVGVEPIGIGKPAGTYSGAVTITLTP